MGGALSNKPKQIKQENNHVNHSIVRFILTYIYYFIYLLINL